MILLARRGKAYLTDFGLSVGLAHRFLCEAIRTRWYIVPELFPDLVPYDRSGDM
jgi:serine/threonine protein kinase